MCKFDNFVALNRRHNFFCRLFIAKFGFSEKNVLNVLFYFILFIIYFSICFFSGFAVALTMDIYYARSYLLMTMMVTMVMTMMNGTELILVKKETVNASAEIRIWHFDTTIIFPIQ